MMKLPKKNFMKSIKSTKLAWMPERQSVNAESLRLRWRKKQDIRISKMF